jgi:hypothetical protein
MIDSDNDGSALSSSFTLNNRGRGRRRYFNNDNSADNDMKPP